MPEQSLTIRFGAALGGFLRGVRTVVRSLDRVKAKAVKTSKALGKDFARGVNIGLGGVPGGILNLVTRPFSTAAKIVTSIFRGMLSIVRRLVTGVFSAIRRVISGAVRLIRGAITGLVSFVKRATVVIGAAVAGAFGLAKLAATATDVRNKFGVVFRGVERQILPFLKQLNRAFKLPLVQLQEYAATLQDTLVPLLKNRKQAAILSKRLLELALDASSFSDVPLGETIDRFTSALVGNHEAVRRFGIVITETALKTEFAKTAVADLAEQMDINLKKMEKGSEESQRLVRELGKLFKELSVGEKATLRLRLIMAGLTDAQGDLARTAREGSNTFRILWANIRDVGTAIGEVFLPIIERLNVTMSGVFASIATTVRKWNNDIAISTLDGWNRVRNVIFGALSDVLGFDLTERIFDKWAGFTGRVEALWERIKTAAIDTWHFMSEIDWGAAWDTLFAAADRVWQFITQKVWPTLRAGAERAFVAFKEIDWGTVFQQVVTGLILAKEALRQVVDLIREQLNLTLGERAAITGRVAAGAFERAVGAKPGIVGELAGAPGRAVGAVVNIFAEDPTVDDEMVQEIVEVLRRRFPTVALRAGPRLGARVGALAGEL